MIVNKLYPIVRPFVLSAIIITLIAVSLKAAFAEDIPDIVTELTRSTRDAQIRVRDNQAEVDRLMRQINGDKQSVATYRSFLCADSSGLKKWCRKEFLDPLGTAPDGTLDRFMK